MKLQETRRDPRFRMANLPTQTKNRTKPLMGAGDLLTWHVKGGNSITGLVLEVTKRKLAPELPGPYDVEWNESDTVYRIWWPHSSNLALWTIEAMDGQIQRGEVVVQHRAEDNQ